MTNRRSSVSPADATENIGVVNSDEIEQQPSEDLGQALKYVPGIDIMPRQNFGQPTSISIQGADSRQVRVMVDGVPFNTQSSGQVNPAIFPVENISRIEIIKGAASSIWGSSLGGTINIITKETGNTPLPKGNITTSFAEFNTQKESAEFSGKTANLGYYLFSSYMVSSGRGAKNDSLEKKGFSKLSYDLEDNGRIIASFGYSGADVNSGIFPDGTWQAQPYQSRYGKVGWQLDSQDISAVIDLKHSRQDIVTKSFLSETDAGPFFIIRTRDLLYQLSLNSSVHPRGKDLLVAGIDSDWDLLKSNTYLTKSKSLKTEAPYVNYTLKLSPWDLNFGLRYDRNSEFGDQTSPSLGLVYYLKSIPDTSIRATVSQAFNAPPLLWKFNANDLFGVAPNPDIKPERAWVYESVLEAKLLSKAQARFSVYRADVSEAIALAENDQGLFMMKNFEKFRRQGGELQFKVFPAEGLSVFSSVAFNDIVDRATKKVVKGGGKTRRSFNFGLDSKTKKGFGFCLKGYYNFWNEPESMQANDRKTLLDLRTTQELKNLILFLDIHNLGNSKYWQDYFFPLPRRYFEGGVTLKW